MVYCVCVGFIQHKSKKHVFPIGILLVLSVKKRERPALPGFFPNFFDLCYQKK